MSLWDIIDGKYFWESYKKGMLPALYFPKTYGKVLSHLPKSLWPVKGSSYIERYIPLYTIIILIEVVFLKS